jgi:acyl-CoA thioester hydrolase
MTFAHRIRVRYAEIDGQGVVFNAHWLTYFDDSCTRFIESLDLGPGFWITEYDVMLVHAEIDWHGPARFDEWVTVHVTPVRLGTKSFDLQYRAGVADPSGHRLCCSATITYCGVRPGHNTPVEIPPAARAALEDRLEERLEP